MGRPKLLLPWGNTSVLGHLLRVWAALGARQTAVVHAGRSDILRELDALGHPDRWRIRNPDAARGMFSSIRCAAAWDGWDTGLDRWVVVLGDQPHLRTATLETLLQLSAHHPSAVCRPYWEGRPRHPVILPRTALAGVGGSPAGSLREFLEGWCGEFAGVAIADPGLGLDLDHPADYERALRESGLNP